MPVNLWSRNTPKNFWQCDPTISEETWGQAVQCAMPTLGLPHPPSDMNELLKLILGEGQFGENHWNLSAARRLYYVLKPFLPRTVTRALRQILHTRHSRDFELGWPIEARYPRFQFEVLRCLLELSGQASIRCCSLWPDGKRFAFVLTHDIETDKGQQFVRHVADLEESLGFRSSFNFVPEGYRVDMELANELHQRGFEVGIHGLKHDGKLFNSRTEFERRVIAINHYLKGFGAVGFRTPLTHRNPEWMQSLDIEYDLSFFDTDPFEPIPGGTMSIWPFFLGRFMELPYTLVQDYTLTSILGETTPGIWLEKVDFIEKYYGMALLNSHPDYLRDGITWDIFREFLTSMKRRNGFWHGLPREAAQWWRDRESSPSHGMVSMDNGQLIFTTAVGVGVHS